MMKTVLILDDDPIVISLYTALFRHAGFDVHSAYDAESALERLGERDPDAVLLDLQLPRLNGLQWLSAVREQPRFKSLPVVILTAGKIAELTAAAEQSDALCVLSKQKADPDEVVRWVTAAVSRSDQNRANKLATD
jgi:two-component system chemotaxis response regulator CheY